MYNCSISNKAIAAANTIKDINFSSPFDNAHDLGKLFLVEYDNTTNVQAGRSKKSYDLQALFFGYGIFNAIKYTDTGVSSIDYRGNGSVVYQNRTIAMTTEAREKATMIFESLGDRDVMSRIVCDHGILFLSTNSTAESFSKQHKQYGIVVYKDTIDDRTENIISIAWEWK